MNGILHKPNVNISYGIIHQVCYGINREMLTQYHIPIQQGTMQHPKFYDGTSHPIINGWFSGTPISGNLYNTLWWTNILPWKITMFNGKIHYKWPFSIAMLVHQRVSQCSSPKALQGFHQALFCFQQLAPECRSCSQAAAAQPGRPANTVTSGDHSGCGGKPWLDWGL